MSVVYWKENLETETLVQEGIQTHVKTLTSAVKGKSAGRQQVAEELVIIGGEEKGDGHTGIERMK